MSMVRTNKMSEDSIETENKEVVNTIKTPTRKSRQAKQADKIVKTTKPKETKMQAIQTAIDVAVKELTISSYITTNHLTIYLVCSNVKYTPQATIPTQFIKLMYSYLIILQYPQNVIQFV